MSAEVEGGAESIEQAGEQRQDAPRVYVADLAAYNNGYLHGVWVDATQEPAAMWEDVSTMLARSPVAGAEELAIHDYENFGPLQLSEYESIDTVSRIGRGYAEHGAAFLHWVSYIGTSDLSEIDRFEDAYLGTYESIRDLGEEMAGAEEIEGIVETHLPEFIQPYVSVDFEAFGRDLASDFHVAETSGGVFVFAP